MFDLGGIAVSDENALFVKRFSQLTGKNKGAVIDAALEKYRKQYAPMLDEIDAIIAKYEGGASTKEVTQEPKKRGRRPKTEKMSKEEFVEYFGSRDMQKVRDVAEKVKAEEAEW